MSRPSDAERERVLDKVEDAMLVGITRPSQIMRQTVDGDRQLIADVRTAKNYMDLVRARWRIRNSDTELERQRLLVENDMLLQRAYGILGRAQAENNLNAQVGAMRNISDIMDKRAQLLGVKTFKPIESADKIEEQRKARYEELVAGRNTDPLRDLYGVVPQDPGQGNGADDSVRVESPATGDSAGQAGDDPRQ